MTLRFATRFLFFLFLFFGGLYFTKELLVPIAVSGLLAMLLRPLCAWLESKRISRGLASLLSVMALVLVVGGIVFVLGWQLTGLVSEVDKTEKMVQEQLATAQQWISKTFSISPQKQMELIKEQKPSAGGAVSGIITSVPGAILGALTNIVLGVVYLFLFLYLRRHLKRFVYKLAPEKDKALALEVLQESTTVAQKYLGGLFRMIVLLWVLYGIGYSIVGLKSPIFFAVLCGLLEIVPYVGNLSGSSLTALVALGQGGGSEKVLGVFGVYLFVQFFQTYILEPLVVGDAVKINPLFTILSLVLGELVWGIPGMIVVVPIVGVAKIICDRVPALQPYGYLIGQEKDENEIGTADKIKARLQWWFRNWRR